MLFDLMTGRQLFAVPFERQFREFMARMTPAEISAIKLQLHDMIDGTEIQTAG